MHVFPPIGGSRLALDQISETAGHRLDRRERIIQLMTQHPQQSLPRGTFFFAQRLTQISQHEQLMLHAAFPKSAAANFPTPHAARKYHLHRIWTSIIVTVKACGESKLLAGTAQQSRRRLSQQFFSGPIYQAQLLAEIEGKDRDIDLGHYRTQQGRGFQCPESLPAKCGAQIIYLEHHLAQSISGGGPSAAN